MHVCRNGNVLLKSMTIRCSNWVRANLCKCLQVVMALWHNIVTLGKKSCRVGLATRGGAQENACIPSTMCEV